MKNRKCIKCGSRDGFLICDDCGTSKKALTPRPDKTPSSRLGVTK